MLEFVRMTYKNMDPLDVADHRAADLAYLLKEELPGLQHLEISMEAVGGQRDTAVKATILALIPGHRIVASRIGLQDCREDSALQALDDTFSATRHGLEEISNQFHSNSTPQTGCCWNP